jgi:hypothetical protein
MANAFRANLGIGFAEKEGPGSVGDGSGYWGLRESESKNPLDIPAVLAHYSRERSRASNSTGAS